MRSHWHYSLAGLAAVIALAVAAGPAHLIAQTTATPSVKAVALECPAGTHWDNILQACV
jgi:hypothetical protein